MTKLQIPKFWYSETSSQKPHILARALLPLSWLYQLGKTINQATTITRKSPIPVICIGNLTMGGGGKTPTSRAILDIVKNHGKFATPCFLMRGYGGHQKGAIEVDRTSHTSWDVGDEALMQADYAPVIVSKNRYKGALLAKKRGYDLIIMDDGFQNQKLKKDLSIIVVDGGFGFGNEYCFPSGPLREPISTGIKRANAAIIINRTDEIDTKSLENLRQFDGHITLNNNDIDKSENFIAFAGIARPQKFFDTLEENKYQLHSHFSFPDHHTYTYDELKHIEDRASTNNATIITTEKDWIRLSSAWKSKIICLRIKITFSKKFENYISRFLDSRS